MTTSVRPTKKQRELLVYIEQFIGEHGYSPSYREIMNGCQYTSVATVALHVGNLIKRGHLRKRDHSARSLEVVKNPTSTDVSGTDMASPSNENNSEGQWLLAKTQELLDHVESLPELTSSIVEDVQAVLRTCSVLGLGSQVDELTGRFEQLQHQVSAKDS